MQTLNGRMMLQCTYRMSSQNSSDRADKYCPDQYAPRLSLCSAEQIKPHRLGFAAINLASDFKLCLCSTATPSSHHSTDQYLSCRHGEWTFQKHAAVVHRVVQCQLDVQSGSLNRNERGHERFIIERDWARLQLLGGQPGYCDLWEAYADVVTSLCRDNFRTAFARFVHSSTQHLGQADGAPTAVYRSLQRSASRLMPMLSEQKQQRPSSRSKTRTFCRRIRKYHRCSTSWALQSLSLRS